MSGICAPSAADTLDQARAQLFRPDQGAHDLPQIETLHYELCQLDRPNLASRGLNRPCELNELMARAA